MRKFVSIDIGGTAIKHGVIGENGTILSSGQRKTEADKGGSGILEKAIRIVEDYQKTEEISGICISTAGMVDIEKGEIFYAAPLIPDYAGTRFKETMEQRFHIPCELENDVNCAGLAEYVSGAAKGSRVALMLTVGTGIGGCMILNGSVFRGCSGSACEVGYMYMDGSDFQTLGAASSLIRKVAAWKGEAEDAWDGYRIFEMAKCGDPLCIRGIDEMADVLGKGIANVCCVLNPEIVVLGGGIMAQEDYIKERVEKALERWLIPGIASHTRIVFAKHRNYAGMMGAFYHFQQRQSECLTGR